MTVPRGEMQSLTILTRLLLVAAEAFPARFLSISCLHRLNVLARRSGQDVIGPQALLR